MEENKVAAREKLAAMRLPEDKHTSAYPQLGYKWADAILQSPDLRVTLVEKPQRYQKHVATNRMVPIVRVVDKEIGGYVAEFLGTNADADADAYINSKEPK